MNQDSAQLVDRFNLSLRRVFHHLGPKLIDMMELDLTPRQVFMLNFIRKEGDTTSSQLAELLEVNSSAITVMLDRLEKHEFIARERSKTDRRVVVISLTSFGEEQLELILKKRDKMIHHCLTELGTNQTVDLIQSLEKLAQISSDSDFHQELSKITKESH